MSKIDKINEEYFGKDKAKNYLANDFLTALKGIIQRSIMIYVLKECQKSRSNKKESEDENGNKIIRRGDFDPDNTAFLLSIFSTHQKGFMIDMRMLLGGKSKEAGSGGKFIEDLIKLSTDDFMAFYKGSGSKGKVPRFLVGKLIGSKEKGEDFIDNNRTDIEKAVSELIKKAQKFRDKGYHNKIIKNYEALKFHKDRQPEKYEVIEKIEKIGFLRINAANKRDKATVEVVKISECLNEFAEIVDLYLQLTSDNEHFYSSVGTLEEYVKRTFAVFAKQVPDDMQQKAIKEIAKHLCKSLDVVRWRHNH